MHSSLEIFLLALIDDGVNTTYRLREEAGLSLGTTNPALERLEREALIKKARPGARGRLEYSLARSGHAILATELELMLTAAAKKPPADLEAVLRLTAMASARATKRQAQAILRAAYAVRAQRIRKLRAPGPSSQGPRRPILYRSFLKKWEIERTAAEIRIIQHLQKSIRTKG
jgi:DNA-binding PadR family transcriptional regulator